MSSLHNERPINPILTEDFAALANDPKKYISLQILPPTELGITKDQETFKLFKAADEAFFGDGNTSYVRGIDQPYPTRGDVQVTDFDVICEEYALKASMEKRRRRNAQMNVWGLTLAANAHALALDREKKFFNVLATSGNWTGSFTPTNAWNTSGADIYGDFEAATLSVGKSGRGANSIVMTQTAFSAARKNRALLDAMAKTSNSGIASESFIQGAMAEAFKVPEGRVYVIDSVYNTANAGAAASLDYFSGAWAWVGYIDPNAGQMSLDGVSVNCFTTALLRAQVEPPSASTWFNNDPPSEVMAQWFNEGLARVFARCGCLIHGVV